ncbi:MerR family DNA-binding protein [Streptomyces sp. NPDC005811]|uniref:MerR family DNA-binding protein n=1 Tax=Streptomyces sp. NPDC005811 TaxID=3154565 RepID=UPI00340AECED
MTWLAFIDAAKHLGLPLEEIAELLGVWESGVCADVKADLRPRIAARLGTAEQRIAELRTFASSLRDALRTLDSLPDRSSRCDRKCGFLSPAASGPVDVVFTPIRPAPEENGERRRSAPVACSLTGDDLDERAAEWRTAAEGAERTAIPDGIRLTLPAERAAAVATLAAAEQQCCPFFDFRLHLDGPHLHLEVKAPAEGTALLDALFSAIS